MPLTRGVAIVVVLGLALSSAPAAAFQPPAERGTESALARELRSLRAAAARSGSDRLVHFWTRLIAHVTASAAEQRRLADQYSLGDGTRRDDARAVFWYRRAAAQGDEAAEHALAAAYYSGRGVARDRAESLRRLAAAARGGHPAALVELSIHVRRGTAPAGLVPPGIPAEPEAMVHAALERLSIGLARAERHGGGLGGAYAVVAHALLCPDAAPGDRAAALPWLGHAARHGHAHSAWVLGVMAAGGGAALYCGQDWVARQADAAR